MGPLVAPHGFNIISRGRPDATDLHDPVAHRHQRKTWICSSANVRRSLFILSLLAVGGCSSTLETGYKPHLLGDSGVKRRAYYAQPFTPEAQAGQTEQEQQLEMRRPRPAY